MTANQPNSTHPVYDAHAAGWERISDVIDGEDAVKAKGVEYLPRLKGHEGINAALYESYKARATFHAASSRTLEGLLGQLFRQDPVVQVPDAQKILLESNTAADEAFDEHAKAVARELIGWGRVGILVDVADDQPSLPYQTRYCTQDIVNWRELRGRGTRATTLVVLRETSWEDKDGDEFARTESIKYRVLRLRDDAVYTQQLYTPTSVAGTQTWVGGEEIAPTRKGAPLNFIPFQIVNTFDLSWRVYEPPLLPLVNTNLSHYRTSADLEHGAHQTAIPTPWIAGDIRGEGDAGGELRIGADWIWNIEKEGKVGMLEFTGQGLGAVEKLLDRKEKQMAVLGARLLEDQKVGMEAADTVRLRHRGESSILASISRTVSAGLQRALDWQVWWAGGPEQGSTVTLNTKILPESMTAEEVSKLVEAWIKGGIGGQVLYQRLVDGEIIQDLDFEGWRQDVIENGPAAILGDAGLDFNTDPEDLNEPSARAAEE